MLQNRFTKVEGDQLGRQVLEIHALNDGVVPVDFGSILLHVVERRFVQFVDVLRIAVALVSMVSFCSCNVSAFCWFQYSRVMRNSC